MASAAGVVAGDTLADRAETSGVDAAREVGHKAANLAWLSGRGYRVPPFFVLSAATCAGLLAPVQSRIDELVADVNPDDPVSLQRCSEGVAALITTVDVTDEFTAVLRHHVDSMGAETRLAVRSSVSGEDSADNSFAGQLDSILNVGVADVPAAVLRCLASAYSARSLFYRAHRGVLGHRIDAAVIVQQLIDGAVSGVSFSCNPQSGNLDEAVVSAGLGLGEGVASGTVECDTFFVDLANRRITGRTVNEKQAKVISAEGGGTALTVGDVVDTAALTDDQVLSLATTAAEIAQSRGVPQDVEWTIDHAGVMHVLQARPVTAVGARETIYDNVNVAESYPGLTSPLTFTFVQRAYAEVFKVCHRYFGATRATIAANSLGVYPFLLATLHGRMYYNISNWYELFLQIPGMDFAIAGWEAALGIENRYERPAGPGTRWRRVTRKFWLLRALVILGWGCLRLPARLRAFFADLASASASLDALLAPDTPVRERDAHVLVTWLDQFMSRLAPSYSAQIFNDFVAQQLFGLVESLLRRAGSDDAPQLRNELFCGESGMHSVEPVQSALVLTEVIRGDARLRSVFDDVDDDHDLWGRLAGDPAFARFHAKCRDHIAAYGDRTVNELKLETDTMTERPVLLVAILRNYLAAGRNLTEMSAREQRIRQSAQERTATLLRRSPMRRLLFAVVLRSARATVKQRENMRLGRSRCFGLAKRVYRVLGSELTEAGLIEQSRDIFFLTFDEVAAIIRGTFVDGDPRRLIAGRRDDYQRWESEVLDSRIVTTGIAAAHVHDPLFAESGDTDVRTGLGCAPGRVRAPALVLLEPSAGARVNGEILVAATTDPGWVFLMVAASGLVSEKGSILSHTAIIGRELGIPTVVGVAGVTRWVRDGDIVSLDGRAGTVRTTGRDLL